MKAFIQYANVRKDESRDCFQTIGVPVERRPMDHHLRGLSFTASGYGSRIPTEYMIQVNGKWRRVYCRIYSNNGTLFIGKRYNGSNSVDIDREE